jgi:hypothetical protein
MNFKVPDIREMNYLTSHELHRFTFLLLIVVNELIDMWNVIPVPYKLLMWHLHQKGNAQSGERDNETERFTPYRVPVICLHGINTPCIIQNKLDLFIQVLKRIHFQNWLRTVQWFPRAAHNKLVVSFQIFRGQLRRQLFLNSEQAELFQSCLLLILLNIDVETGL